VADVDFRQAVQRLREVRLARGALVEDVAREAHISASALRNYEAGLREPDLSTLQRWATALGQRAVFDLRGVEADTRASVVAERVAQMDETKGSMAAKMVDLAARAAPGQLRAALAALEALIGAAAEEASPARAGGPAERA
jgi:transcriptional regulator with XRE-family HTH domain